MATTEKIVDMHVVPGVLVAGEIKKIMDYRLLKNDPKNFVGIVLSTGVIIHIPTDRGQVMEKLADAFMAIWNNPKLNIAQTNTAAKALFFESNVAIMVTYPKGQTQYRFYDADAPETFQNGAQSGAARNKIVHTEYMTI